jgi:hypothetical protein
VRESRYMRLISWTLQSGSEQLFLFNMLLFQLFFKWIAAQE